MSYDLKIWKSQYTRDIVQFLCLGGKVGGNVFFLIAIWKCVILWSTSLHLEDFHAI